VFDLTAIASAQRILLVFEFFALISFRFLNHILVMDEDNFNDLIAKVLESSSNQVNQQ
jgi:hypothetical protein